MTPRGAAHTRMPCREAFIDLSESSPDSSSVLDYFNNSGKRVGYFHELWRDFSCSASASGSWPSGINTAVFNYSVNLHPSSSFLFLVLSMDSIHPDRWVRKSPDCA